MRWRRWNFILGVVLVLEGYSARDGHDIGYDTVLMLIDL